MKQLVAWFAKNHVAANLLMLVIIFAGLITIPGIKKEIFPEYSTDLVSISVEYLGAAPEEVEEGVCVRIEEAIYGLDGIKKITSTASENVGSVLVELLDDADMSRVLEDIKTRVDGIDTFPEEAEEPVVQEVLARNQVLNVAVSGDTDERTLKVLGERLRDEISSLPGITQVFLTSVRPYEISIEVSEESLRRYGLTFDQVANAVRRSSLDLPGGSIKAGGGEILLRTKSQAYRGHDFEDIVLVTRPDGTRLMLSDVATVIDGFRDTDQSARFDGHPTVMLQVFRVGDQNALEVAAIVKNYLAEAEGRLPEGIELTPWWDRSRYLQSRLDLMLRNARTGYILVFLLLAFFLRFKLAWWVSLGIPISFLGAIWLMPGLDVSINMISLFAFIVVLGIVVDDAIIVGENIYSHYERTGKRLESAIKGAQEVSIPVLFAVLTTIAAFSPMLNVPGSTGQIMRVIPIIVIATLVFSLIESLLILPAHLAKIKDRPHRPNLLEKIWVPFQEKVASALRRFIDKAYRPSLEFALRWRYLTVAWGLMTLLLTAGLVGGGFIQFRFLPNVEADFVVAMLTMPQGTPPEVTAHALRDLEETARQVGIEIDAEQGNGHGEGVFRHFMVSIGEMPYRSRQSSRGPGSIENGFSGGHLGEVQIELAPSEERDLSSQEILKRWRDRAGMVPDAVELTFTSSIFSPGSPIDVQMSGPSLDDLRDASNELKLRLAEYPGVFDIADSYRTGKREVKLALLPSAEPLGLTAADLARQVRQGFYGEEVQRVQRGRDDIRVMVRYPDDERRSLGDLENMRVRTPAGDEVPFSSVAIAELGRGFSAIERSDRARTLHVTADVDPSVSNSNDIIAELQRTVLPEVTSKYPGLSYSFEGERREQQETMGGLARGFMLAIFMIYALLAIPFRSYIQPVIIMSAIPFGLVGAVWGHVIMGLDLTILSMFGIVALTGVVVNDSLVLVDFINRKRGEGIPLHTAVREAGVVRFRPILLTSLTTFAGLSPLLLEKSVQAKFLVPMAVSLGWGVLFATFITLMLVPAGYLILEDLLKLPARLRGRQKEKDRLVTDAGRAQS